jgi:Flp pilus assembly protein TadG
MHNERTSQLGTRHERRRRQAGAASVEMIVVLPFLLLMLFATIEFAMLGREWVLMQNAARVAARTLSMGEPDFLCNRGTKENEARDAAQGLLDRVGITVSNLDVTAGDPACQPGVSGVLIEREIPMTFLRIFAPSVQPITLRARAEMRNEA